MPLARALVLAAGAAACLIAGVSGQTKGFPNFASTDPNVKIVPAGKDEFDDDGFDM